MSDTLPLQDKIAVVTGASRGIGRASALALAKAGAHVVAVARTEGGLTELDDEIRAATGQPATLVPLDVADGEALDGLGLALHQRFGRIDVLVHAAAILGPMTPVAHIDKGGRWGVDELIKCSEDLFGDRPTSPATFPMDIPTGG